MHFCSMLLLLNQLEAYVHWIISSNNKLRLTTVSFMSINLQVLILSEEMFIVLHTFRIVC